MDGVALHVPEEGLGPCQCSNSLRTHAVILLQIIKSNNQNHGEK